MAMQELENNSPNKLATTIAVWKSTKEKLIEIEPPASAKMALSASL